VYPDTRKSVCYGHLVFLWCQFSLFEFNFLIPLAPYLPYQYLSIVALEFNMTKRPGITSMDVPEGSVGIIQGDYFPSKTGEDKKEIEKQIKGKRKLKINYSQQYRPAHDRLPNIIRVALYVI